MEPELNPVFGDGGKMCSSVVVWGSLGCCRFFWSVSVNLQVYLQESRQTHLNTSRQKGRVGKKLCCACSMLF